MDREQGPAELGCFPPWMTAVERDQARALFNYGATTKTLERGLVLIAGKGYARCCHCNRWIAAAGAWCWSDATTATWHYACSQAEAELAAGE